MPNHKNAPASSFQVTEIAGISCAIALDLWPPEFESRLGQSAVPTVVPMPEATVDQDDSASGRKDYVRLTGQVRAMKPKSVPCTVQHSSYHQLGRRVLTFDVSHEGGARPGSQTINQSGLHRISHSEYQRTECKARSGTARNWRAPGRLHCPASEQWTCRHPRSNGFPPAMAGTLSIARSPFNRCRKGRPAARWGRNGIHLLDRPHVFRSRQCRHR